MYSGCPIVWKSQLQTEIVLSSTESEYWVILRTTGSNSHDGDPKGNETFWVSCHRAQY